MPRFLIGMDLAREIDFTAIVVADTLQGCYDVGFLDRFRPERENLFDVVHRLADLLEGNTALRLDSALAFDATGLGRPFQPLLMGSSVGKIIPIFPIVATHGWRPANQRDDGVIYCPKSGLVDVFSRALEARRVRCSPSLPLAPILRRELGAYRQTQGPDGLPRWGARKGEHDDIVSALMLVIWLGERLRKQGRTGLFPANRREIACRSL